MRLGPLLLVAFAVACAPAPDDAALVWDDETMPVLGSDANGAFYRYAPSIVQLSPDVRYAFTCGNARSGVVRDFLFVRRATLDGSGWRWGAESIALPPSNERDEAACRGFDCYHVCDPELVAGRFARGDRTYRYALLYTGNDVDASRHNGIGVAYADAPEGPWVRLDRPLVAYGDVCPEAEPHGWGVGQPSATSIDGGGRLLVFARTECAPGKPRPLRWEVDLSNLDAPRVSRPLVMPIVGLTASTRPRRNDRTLNNASWVYDSTRDRFFIVRSQHPMPRDPPKSVSARVQIASIEARAAWSGEGTWRPLGEIAPFGDEGNAFATGFARNSNAAIVRDAFGGLPRADEIEIAYTTNDAIGFPDWLWTKRVHVVRARLRF